MGDLVKIRQSKEKIRDLWLDHPNKHLRNRLHQVYNTMGGLCEEFRDVVDETTRKWCIQELDEMLLVDPLHLETLHTRALLFLMDGNLAGCREDIEHTLAIEKRHFPSMQILFRISELESDYNAMDEVARKLSLLCPRDPDVPKENQSI